MLGMVFITFGQKNEVRFFLEITQKNGKDFGQQKEKLW